MVDIREHIIFMTAYDVGMQVIEKEVAKYDYVQHTLDNEGHLGMLTW
jgi:hypothetical protein